jgi:hypothetical protein
VDVRFHGAKLFGQGSRRVLALDGRKNPIGLEIEVMADDASNTTGEGQVHDLLKHEPSS